MSDKYINSSGLQTIKNWVENKIPTSTSDLTNDSGFATETYVNTAVSNKQDILTFDNTPTENSNNPVKSGGIYTALTAKQNTLTFDTNPTQNSTNPVTSGGIYTAIENIDNIYIATCTTNPSSSDVATLHAEIWSATSLGKTVFLKYNNHIYTLATTPASSSDDVLFFRATAATIGASAYPVNERIQVTTTTISTTLYIGGTFIAVYGSTTRAQLLNAYNNGLNIVLMYDDPNNANYHYIAPLSRAIIGSGSNSWRFTCVTETTLYDFFLNTSSVWYITTRAIATEAYVDDICGDIETALSTINTALGGMV